MSLRLHGPHALLGGTTGAGKSELLRTWIDAPEDSVVALGLS